MIAPLYSLNLLSNDGILQHYTHKSINTSLQNIFSMKNVVGENDRQELGGFSKHMTKRELLARGRVN